GIPAAASERRHVAAVGDALVAGDDHELSPRELVLNPERTHFDDARVHVSIVGDDAGLAAGEADGVAALLANGHRQQGHGDAFSRREQHVELAAVRVRRHLLGQRQQFVGGVAHRRHDNHDIVSLPARLHDAIGDLAQPGDIGHARAAVLLDHYGHKLTNLKSGIWNSESGIRAIVSNYSLNSNFEFQILNCYLSTKGSSSSSGGGG